MLVYAKYARGFKSGGYNADFVSSLDIIAFDDESVDSYEAGLKSQLFDGRLRFNVAAYVSKHKDFQVFSFTALPNGGTALTVTNAGEVTSAGVEVDMLAAVTQWANFRVTYGYNDASFDSFKDGGGVGVDFDGNKLSEAPEHNLGLGADLHWNVGIGELVAQADYNYRSSYYSNPNNLPANLNGSLALLGLRVGVEADRWSFFLWSKNAGDVSKQVYNSVSFLGVPRVTYSEPRTYGATLKYRFGS